MKSHLGQKLAKTTDKGDLRSAIDEVVCQIDNGDVVQTLLLSQNNGSECLHDPGNIQSLGTS